MKTLLRFMDWPIRVKMAALFVVASLLPLAIATLINIREARVRLVENTAALLAARGDQLVDQLETFHRGYQLSVDKFTRLPLIFQFCRADQADTERLRSTLPGVFEAHLGTDPNVRGIVIVDMSGTVTAATENRLVGQNLSYRGYVRAALRGTNTISDIHMAESKAGFEPTIAYLSPVRGPNGHPVAIAMFWVRATALWDVMKASNELAGPGSYAVMFDHQGIRIAHTNSDAIIFHPGGQLNPATIDALVAERRFGEKTRQLLDDVRAFPEQFDLALSKSPERGVFRGFAPVNQKWNYGVARRFQAVPWTLFYMIPEQSLHAQIAQMTRQKTVFAGVIVLIALVGGALFATVILKPIRSLTKATESIAGGDLATRVSVVHSDELGRLGMSFNSMAQRIEAQATALQNARDNLELRVQERTAALERTTSDLEVEIVERKRIDESLRKSEAQLQTIIENLDEGVQVADLKGQILHFNRAALDSHGYSNLEEIRRHMSEFADTFELSELDGTVIPPDQWPFPRVLRGESLHDWEVRIRRIQSDWQRIFSYGGTVVHDAEGRPLMAVVTLSDITGRKQAAEEIRQLNTDLEQRVMDRTAQLETANKELEAFSYSVSHDLRSPLRTIDGFSRAVLEEYGAQLPPEAQRDLQSVRAGAQQMGALIDDLLTFSRLGRQPLSRRILDTPQMVGQCLEELRPQTQGQQIELRVGELPPCWGDPSLLKQVWINLLSNALKYSSKREPAIIEVGAVTVRADAVVDGPAAASENHEIAYFVRDNGVGFDMRYAHKLFGVFERLHRAEDYEGTGVGLATVQRILHRHGGRIWADAAVDEGATFYFTLEGETKP